MKNLLLQIQEIWIVKYGELLTEDEYLELDDEFGIDSDNVTEEDIDEDNYFIGMMGGAAIKKLLCNLDVVEIYN